MKSKYTDIAACLQVIGNVYNNPSLLEDDNLFFNEEDFTEDFHKTIFGTIYNLKQLGANEISINTIEDYLKDKPKSLAIYKTNKGEEWIMRASASVQQSTFNYYYQRMKKMTLLREYDKVGMDLTWLYDPDNILEPKKRQSQEEWLDNTPLNKIADTIDQRISEIRLRYVNDDYNQSVQAGSGVMSLLQRYKESPDFGIPMYGSFINTVTRGARLGKFYLRSGATGTGKTRSMIADCCFFGCDEFYDIYSQQWIKNGICEPTLYITTEQEEDEIQTMMLAFLSGINETTILEATYNSEQWERICYAAKVLEKSKIFIKKMPEFSMRDVETTIKTEMRKHDVKYICFDYIHSNMKILGEVTSQTGVKGLREDNILFMIGVKLKEICVEYNVFIISGTQLNGDYTSATEFDQNLLRGAKSLGDKVDVGMILLQTTEKDKEALQPLITKNNLSMPNIKLSVYKNRRGQHKGVLLWCNGDLGTCRINPIFMTDYGYKYLPINETKINVTPPVKASAF